MQRNGGKLASSFFFFSLVLLFFFFPLRLNVFIQRVPPEDEIANEQHISVNIRYLFPMQPVNTDKRQHHVILWLRILKDYAHSDARFLSVCLLCLCVCALVYACSGLYSQVCVAYLALRSSEHDDVPL